MATCRRLGALALATCTLLTTSGAHAQAHDLRWDARVDVPVTLVASAVWMATLALSRDLAPAACRWCDSNPLDDGARHVLAWRNPRLADDASDFTAFLFAPAAAYGLDALAAWHDGARRGFGVDALLITEATVLAVDVAQLTKILVARERPYVHSLRRGDDGLRPHSGNDDVAFFSGHTTGAFALAASTGAIATMRGYRWAPVPWIATGVFAVGTGYLRIGADQHWLTDVLVSMIVGVGVGIAVPVLFHSPAGG